MNRIPGCALILLTALLEVAYHEGKGVTPCDYPCPAPPSWPLTEADEARNCSSTAGRHRYRCVAGHRRKAGTSNLIKCTKEGGGQEWSKPYLECIPDPKMASTSGPGVVPGPRTEAPATRIIHATEPATQHTAEPSTADQEIGQTTYRTAAAADPSDGASYGPATMAPTHADAPTGSPPSGSASALATPSPAQGAPRDDEGLEADPVQRSDAADGKHGRSGEESSGALVPGKTLAVVVAPGRLRNQQDAGARRHGTENEEQWHPRASTGGGDPHDSRGANASAHSHLVAPSAVRGVAWHAVVCTKPVSSRYARRGAEKDRGTDGIWAEGRGTVGREETSVHRSVVGVRRCTRGAFA